MALKALMLRKKIDKANKELAELRSKEEDFTKREAEITEAVDEAETEEEIAAVEEAANEYDAERSKWQDEIKGLEKSVSELESELAAEEVRAGDAERDKDGATKPAEQAMPVAEMEQPEETHTIATREGASKMHVRDIFARFTKQERDAMFQRDDVKAYIGSIRDCISNKRSLTNVGLTIPEVFLGILRENVINYSKLYKHCNVQQISGTGRQVIMGSVPEAIWTECCAVLNELSLGFNDVEVDCYKVGGYFKVCNAVLEDSDINLASTLLDAIGQAIGIALDKAILYGRNDDDTMKMPQGIASRLVQTSQPAGYPATARAWVDLHSTNILSIASNVHGVDFFKALTIDSGAMKGKYSRGEKVWVMNEKTYTYLMAESMSINAAGAIVAGASGTMPVIGGVIEILEFIPDNVIFGGFFDLYLLAERGGDKFAQSEHVFFIQDQTVFKGVARYDGQVVIPEAFLMVGINGVTPDDTMSFAPDTANQGE